MRHLDEYLNKVTSLPPAPRVLPELLTLLNEENVDASRVVAVISLDPGLTASVLQLCNSAFFATATAVEDIQEALTRLGFNQVYQLVAALIGGKTMGPPQAGYGIDKGELWKHSITAAIAAERVAAEVGEPPTLVYTAALLHDVGKIVLSDALVERYDRLIQETEREQHPLVETEKKILGVEHAEIGGRLLARWRFPVNLTAAVTYHHSPKEAGQHAKIASCVYIGNMLAHFMGYGYGHVPFAQRGRNEALDILGISADALPRFMISTFEKLGLIQAMFRIAP